MSSKLKKLGEGSFGCVVSHPLKCSDKEVVITSKKTPPSKQVGKLFYDKEDYKDELRLAKVVKKIDPSEKKIVIPISGCTVSKNILEKEENINAIMRCEKITNKDSVAAYFVNSSAGTVPRQVWQLKMPYAGSEIDRALEKYKGRLTVRSLAKMMLPLIEAVILLKSKKMIHQDIKQANVLLDKNKARMIDFSLMIPYDEVYTMNNYYRLKKRYRPFPPEYYLASLVMKYEHNLEDPKTMHSIKRDIVEKYKLHLERISYYFTPFYSTHEVLDDPNYKSLLQLMMKSMNSMEKLVDKVDIYSVGILLAELAMLYAKDPMHNKRFVAFVRGLINPDPRFRTSPEDALKQCKKLSM